MADGDHLIFINYRGSDQHWGTELVYARLTEAFGTDAVFKAGNALPLGEEFPLALLREATSCPVMLVCIGPGWLTATEPDGSRRLDSPGDWVREEIATSLQAGNNVVPLLIGNLDEVALPKADLLPEPIRALVYRQARRLVSGADLDATIPMLVDKLAELVPELAERRRARSAQEPRTMSEPTINFNNNDGASVNGQIGVVNGGANFYLGESANPPEEQPAVVMNARASGGSRVNQAGRDQTVTGA